ncbi:UDPglucose--hexose-1-phosphate uridylyltransferase [Micromonospora phaseoli]|uniref:Galactose-1-phosphate uridylyltransferase n=1 Tax=Micromonospora phaseoli TaxID=1144548 RepID=A0A1H6X888_9ACTN|nr:galactose-1-phosphate uridylyltransferase [Micromonospora phaseoli]PZW01961.1 UDPglucose--hexose-1-phosphate uridylyltransferase [Micromonospora phaseoli]GIJ80905.1 galactose-1-phosphate uridylyltransferase [Micromonospora phaseoli]SEJ20745.1 UDPglucose--hexose-1-phosphate uridylyltransferase [Micromonospora phaseoli]
MRRTEITLADGRELVYFDERDDAVRDQPDRRELPAPPPASQLRHDPLTDEWVALAAHRQARTFLPPADQCPLCPSTAERLSEIPAPEYAVAVFENRFPALSDRVVDEPAEITPFTAVRPGQGRCEVVCFTDDHHASFAGLPPHRVRTVLDALADRTTVLGGLAGVEQVFCFENRGVEIGVTLHHPHGQIYAYPFLTPRTRSLLGAARRHAARTGGGNLYADVLAAERAAGERVVATNEHWTAYVPAAARWPFEVHLAPHRPVPDIPALTDVERDAFGPLYLDLLRRFDGLFDTPMPYIAAWHQAPVRIDRELAHLHLQLFSVRRAADKLKYLAGSESAMGVFINDIAPERAADLLRAV